MDCQALYQLVGENYKKIVTIELYGPFCYIYKTKTTRFTKKRKLVSNIRGTYKREDLPEILAFLHKHHFEVDIRDSLLV
ncbi:hypothetical protein [Enterococcus sp. CSURQ0835]|uniref:hypothetical protein n=1 Tax=Enterococcus sp. CSURQ0835 TaxID=2681394 RepID=UPI001357459B|nr:hypothetical protein [Enterococcus sp. CSURQ0835]